MNKTNHPHGPMTLAPKHGSMTAKVVKYYDTGKYKTSAELLIALNRYEKRRFTYSHISGALNRWRPEWGGKDKQLNNFEKVREFHMATDTPVLHSPQVPPPDRRTLRIELIREEFEELKEAVQCHDMVGIADGIGDLLYVLYGMAHEYGIQIDRVFEEIHRSNMSKLGADGRPILREDGKVLKGPFFTPPDIESQLAWFNEPA